ncbi:MAG: SDR family oxidoreductase [Leptolinea sp.]
MVTNLLKNKTVVVTGATSGIGKVAAEALAGMGASLLLVGRNEAKGNQMVEEIKSKTGNPDLIFLTADLSSMTEVRRLAGEINTRAEKIDVLLNNAGAVFMNHQTTVDGYEMTLALNHLSPFLLTDLLLNKLKAAPVARIVTVSSIAHLGGKMNFEDLMCSKSYNSWRAYSNSKLANILFTYHLAKTLKDTRITANTLHPGFVKTNFGLSNGGIYKSLMAITQIFAISAEEGAKTSIYLASSPEVEGVTGKYFIKSKPADSSTASHNEETATRLWDASLKLTGLA